MGQLRQFLKLWNTTIICGTVSWKCGTVRKSGTAPQKVEQVLSLYHCLIWYKYIAAIWNHNVYMMIYYNVIQVDCCFETRNSILFVIIVTVFCTCSTFWGAVPHRWDCAPQILELNCGTVSFFQLTCSTIMPVFLDIAMVLHVNLITCNAGIFKNLFPSQYSCLYVCSFC